MKRPFPQIALQPGGQAAIAVQVAIPFSVLRVGKMGETPVMHLLVQCRIFFEAGQLPRQLGGDEGLAMRPPKLNNCGLRKQRKEAGQCVQQAHKSREKEDLFF